ncbi:MAG TPA: hypothetical protein VHG72_06125 [Polyangia bacterium]|nr:hypothetical protein [Polyangia bacterium]HVZ86524.1 hypothetical protein [Polyangia bacterium]
MSRPDENAKEATCGQEMAESAEVPLRWQALMDHVAANMEAHAASVGTGTPAAAREHAAIRAVAREYRAMAAAAGRAAQAMWAMRDLPAVPHDARKLDRAAQLRWMRRKIEMQRAFAALLARHAEDSEAALAGMEREAR